MGHGASDFSDGNGTSWQTMATLVLLYSVASIWQHCASCVRERFHFILWDVSDFNVRRTCHRLIRQWRCDDVHVVPLGRHVSTFCHQNTRSVLFIMDLNRIVIDITYHMVACAT